MTLFFYYGSGDFGNNRIRLGEGFSFTEAAESGTLSMSSVIVEDPLGTLDIVGHRSFRAIETACSWDSLFRGYFADRTIRRDKSLITGAARIWDSTVYDLNGALEFEVIQGTGGKRPAETDTQRLAWLLGSSYLGPISSDDSHVFGADEDMDKADYRGMTMADVLNDCGQVSGNNYFVAWDDSLGSAALHYYHPTRAHNSSSLSISNVLSDVDQNTVFAPSADLRLNRDPSRRYTGVYYQYGEKASAEFEQDSGILSDIGHKREASWQDASVRRASGATRKANVWLAEGATELDTISLTLRKVPPSRVNLIRAGQRIQIKATHLPGFTSYQWMRVLRRTVQQEQDTQLFYRIDLELANPKQAGSRNRRPPKEVAPEVVDGSSVTLARHCLSAYTDRDDGHGGIVDSIAYGATPPALESICEAVDYATTYIYSGCPFGQSGYSGNRREEQWFEFDPGSLTDVVGVRFTFATDTHEGILLSNDYPLIYGYRPSGDGDPTGPFQFTELGTVSKDGGSFTIPSTVLTPNATNYVVLAPGWLAMPGPMACSGELVAGLLGPLGDAGTPGGGEFNSGCLSLDTVAAVTREVSGTGEAPWVPMDGDVDGDNRTFTLTDWNGMGIPRIRIGAVEYAAGDDFTWTDAGVVTLDFTPWVGANLLARWQR